MADIDNTSSSTIPQHGTNGVTEIAPASSQDALRHFSRRLALETDCWDVHSALRTGRPGFVLLDVRSRTAFDAGHIDGAVHLPHAEISDAALGRLADTRLFVVYCAGPHCNGADRAAIRLAQLGHPVKKMIGGVEGWRDEGFGLVP